MKQRKIETHHLDVHFAEYDRKTGDIILTGVKANSKLEYWERPLVKIHIKASPGIVVHLIDVFAQKPAHALEKAQTIITQVYTAIEKRL